MEAGPARPLPADTIYQSTPTTFSLEYVAIIAYMTGLFLFDSTTYVLGSVESRSRVSQTSGWLCISSWSSIPYSTTLMAESRSGSGVILITYSVEIGIVIKTYDTTERCSSV